MKPGKALQMGPTVFQPVLRAQGNPPNEKIPSSRMLYQPGEVPSQHHPHHQLTTDEPHSDIDLAKLISELDITATDLVAHQRDALLSRKDLAQKTKGFRKLDDAAKLVEIKSLLKGRGALHPIVLRSLY